MTVTHIKPNKVTLTMLGLLERESELLPLVWRDPAGRRGHRFVENDTVSLKLPSYVEANENALRSGAARTRSNLKQRKIDVVLDQRIYVDMEITDEEFTLDITSFNTEVVSPIMSALVRKANQSIVDLMTDAGNVPNTSLVLNDADPFLTLLDARAALNDAFVPQNGRYCVVGTGIEGKILASDRLSKVDQSGSDSALRRATIGTMAGFQIVTSNWLPPDQAYCFHRTAYAHTLDCPEVPQGAPWGAKSSAGGLAIRSLQVLDPVTYNNILATEFWQGKNIVDDQGAFDANGKFIPAADPADDRSDAIFVRSVQILDT